MTQQTLELTTSIRDSFRVRQVAGMFDVPLGEKLTERFAYELPRPQEPWQIGLIVGPSGSGKSTVARHAFGDAVYQAGDWPTDQAVIDVLDQSIGDASISIRQLTGLLTSVGFSSPPGWIKPYSVLSNGERFRCDLARALAAGIGATGGSSTSGTQSVSPLVVFDEFTSVVDRQVAQACSAAVAKAVRGGQVGCRFVAVTCHYDVEPWLAPDWTLDMAAGTLHRRHLRRPPLRLEVRRCPRDLWPLFARHHYLSGGLSWGARCYAATLDGVPVAFCAVLTQFARRGAWRISRLVTRPEFQGLGIGTRLAEAIGDLYLAEGLQFGVTAAHPALLRHCSRSRKWRLARTSRPGRRRRMRPEDNYRDAQGRAVATFAYIGGDE
ncbi:MAG: GNAT family N-acetyltransferase [Planctomycetes bacterium]|nr:GNAT family N-acetyltransferase [Planctomycetota bacterium]